MSLKSLVAIAALAATAMPSAYAGVTSQGIPPSVPPEPNQPGRLTHLPHRQLDLQLYPYAHYTTGSAVADGYLISASSSFLLGKDTSRRPLYYGVNGFYWQSNNGTQDMKEIDASVAMGGQTDQLGVDAAWLVLPHEPDCTEGFLTYTHNFGLHTSHPFSIGLGAGFLYNPEGNQGRSATFGNSDYVNAAVTLIHKLYLCGFYWRFDLGHGAPVYRSAVGLGYSF